MSTNPTSSSDRMDTVTAISTSLRAFVCGILGLLPLVGVLPALYALVCWSDVRARFRSEWNPASHYLTAGMVFGSFGLLCSTVLILLFIGSQLYR